MGHRGDPGKGWGFAQSSDPCAHPAAWSCSQRTRGLGRAGADRGPPEGHRPSGPELVPVQQECRCREHRVRGPQEGPGTCVAGALCRFPK